MTSFYKTPTAHLLLVVGIQTVRVGSYGWTIALKKLRK